MTRVNVDLESTDVVAHLSMDIVAATTWHGQERADFKDNSMASRMNSGDSNDLNSNCIRIDPRTGEKFSFNVDIYSRTFIHTFHPMGGVLDFCTVHYVIVDQ